MKQGQPIAHLSLNPVAFFWRQSRSDPLSSASTDGTSLELVMLDLCPGLDNQVPITHTFCLFLA
jgi:hypothetical protein